MPMFNDPEIFKAVLDHLPIGVYMVDRDLKIVFWNHEAEKISGYLAQEVLGRQCREKLLVDLEEENPVACGKACQLTDSMQDGHTKEADVLLRHRAGHRIPVHVRAVPLRNSDNKIIGAAESFEQTRFLAPRERLGGPGEASVTTDGSSGLPDEIETRNCLEQSCADFVEHRLPFCILLAEVDGFAEFRSTHGPEAAEAALQVVKHTLSNALRPSDVLGHWNENRFLAIVNNCESSVVKRVGERVRKMESSSTVEWWGDELSFTVSVGATGVVRDDTVDTLVERAQAALRRSMKDGGDRVTVVKAEEISDIKV